MKKILLITVAMLGVALCGNAANDDETTPNKVREVAEKIGINEDNDWELKSFDQDEKESNWSVVLNGLYFGIGTHNTLDIINNAFEIGVLNLCAVKYDTQKGQSVSVGVGIGNKSYSLKRPFMFDRDIDSPALGIGIYPDGAVQRSSRLYVHSVQFPMMFRQELPYNWRLTFAGIINWNYKVTATNHYEINDIDYDICQKGLKQNNCSFDWLGAVSFNGFSVYCRYRPAKVLKNNYGPRIHDTWTVGIGIGI